MAGDGPASSRRRPSGRSRTGEGYLHEWNRFVAWSDATGRPFLPASPEDVAAYLEERVEEGARSSTINVSAGAIAYHHKDAGFDEPLREEIVRAALDELKLDESPSQIRALPLDLDCYNAIRKTACEPRDGRGGRMELADTARRRGALDIAMIGLMRDGRLRGGEAAELMWGDLELARGGTGLVRVEHAGYRALSADTMSLLLAIREDAGYGDPVLGLRPNQISSRIGAAARQAGLGEGYAGDSPRLGMLRDLETLGVLLLGDRVAGTRP